MVYYKKAVVSTVILVIFSFSLFVPALILGENFPITGPVIIGLASDGAAKSTASQLRQNIPNSKFVRISNENQLARLVQRVIGEIFYVGHGAEQGLQVGSSLLSWSQVSKIIQESISSEHYFAACFSAKITYNRNNKFVVGFPSIIDADVAAFVLTGLWQYVHKSEISESLVRNFVDSNGLEKILSPQQPLYWITWTWSEGKNIGWTPYGLYNPNAIHIHFTAADVAFIANNPSAWAFAIISFVVSMILILFTIGASVVWAVASLLIIGFMLSIDTISDNDANLDGSVDEYIPVDIINFAAGGGLNRYMRTTSWWWLMLLTYTLIPLYQVTPI